MPVSIDGQVEIKQTMSSKWMGDVKGQGGEAGGPAIRRVLSSGDFDALIDEAGGLASKVQKTIAECGYEASDRGGGGEGSWHIGVPFMELEDAVKYLVMMTDTFSKAIYAGILHMELKTWSRNCWKE